MYLGQNRRFSTYDNYVLFPRRHLRNGQGLRLGGGAGGVQPPPKIENMFDFLRKILILSAKFVKNYGEFSQKFGF